MSESLRNGQSLYCFKCPSTRLSIAGIPLILVGVAIFVLFVVHHTIFPESNGAEVTFLPAAFGIALVGVLRLLQTRRLRRQIQRQTEKEAAAATTEKNAVVHPKPQPHGDPEKWDSPVSTTTTPDKIEA